MNLPDVTAPESGSKNFLKLKNGESIRAVFVGDMFSFHTKWVNGKSVPTDNKDPDGKIRFRNNVAVVDPLTNELAIKIWEFPWGVFETIRDINQEYPLETIKVKITRQGEGLETKYSILPLVGPKDILSKQNLAAIAAMPLLPLEKKQAGNAAAPFDHDFSGPPPNFDASDDIPF